MSINISHCEIGEVSMALELGSFEGFIDRFIGKKVTLKVGDVKNHLGNLSGYYVDYTYNTRPCILYYIRPDGTEGVFAFKISEEYRATGGDATSVNLYLDPDRVIVIDRN
jgi:hypothetical protein